MLQLDVFLFAPREQAGTNIDLPPEVIDALYAGQVVILVGKHELPKPVPPPPAPTGEVCTHCGNAALVRTGTCQTCQVCGETTGCA